MLIGKGELSGIGQEQILVFAGILNITFTRNCNKIIFTDLVKVETWQIVR